MWLVLCESYDESALWIYEGLKSYGLDPLELITSEVLSYSMYWKHKLSSEGVNTEISLTDGRIINSSKVKGVFNRIAFVHTDHLLIGNSEDHDYAIQEFNAFFLSWLNALPEPMVNRPTPYGMCGKWRHESEWFWLASKAGLKIPHYRQTSNPDQSIEIGIRDDFQPVTSEKANVIVAGQNVIGRDIPNDIVQACQRFGQLCNTKLLGIEFDKISESNWLFRSATPLPDLRSGGEKIHEILSTLLKTEQKEA